MTAPCEVTADNLTDEEILSVACPACLAARATWCYVEAIDRVGADGVMRDHVVHVPRISAAINARKEIP